jgi:hypothetical protein
MADDEYHAAVAAFIRGKGVTRCPTAWALPTQGSVAAADRAPLEHCALARAQSRRRRQAESDRSFRNPGAALPPDVTEEEFRA